MCARTRRWIESGQTGFGTQRAFLWADSALGFLSALFQFAFAEQFLKVMVRINYGIWAIVNFYGWKDFLLKEFL
jgi:hypothetical protein